MALAIGIFVFGSPPKAAALFQLALEEPGVLGLTVVASGASFGPQIAVPLTGTFGDFGYSFFSATANNGAGGSNLLSSVTEINSLTPGTHVLNLYVTNQDYTLTAGPQLSVTSDMGGTYGSEPGFTGSATFRMWADAGNGLFTIPGTFSNGLQTTTPASGGGVAFMTGTPTGVFTRGAGPYSLTQRTTLTLTGVGDVNYSTHVRLTSVPEPEMPLIMLMVGLLGLFLGVRRQKS